MELSLNPGYSLGPIELGSLLWNVLSILRAEQATFTHVQLSWESEKPATGFLLLVIISPPIRLLFEGVNQRLLLIEAYEPSSHDRPIGILPSLGKWIHYQDQSISEAVAPDESGVTVRVIHRLFGPTYPPAPHITHPDETVVSYPGVAFSFNHEILSRVILSVQPLGDHAAHNEEIIPPTEAYFKPRLPHYMGSIDGDIKSTKIKLGRMDLKEPTSATFSFHSSSPTQELADVNIIVGHSTSEDILCEFGAPLRTFWKEDDRMKIHTHLRSTGQASKQHEEPNPYFMSYFNIGVDFLIDTVTNIVMKVILHSNIPGEVLFARYARCPWSLVSLVEGSDIASSTDKVPVLPDYHVLLYHLINYLLFQAIQVNQQIKLTLGQVQSRTSKMEAFSSTVEHCDSFGSPISDEQSDQKVTRAAVTTFPEAIEPAMLLDRTADLIDDGLVLRRPTRLYGHPGIVLEVTQDDDIETVWLF